MKDTNTKKITMDEVYDLCHKWNKIKELCNKWENDQNSIRKMAGDLIELKVNIHPNKMNLDKPTKDLLNLPSK